MAFAKSLRYQVWRAGKRWRVAVWVPPLRWVLSLWPGFWTVTEVRDVSRYAIHAGSWSASTSAFNGFSLQLTAIYIAVCSVAARIYLEALITPDRFAPSNHIIYGGHMQFRKQMFWRWSVCVCVCWLGGKETRILGEAPPTKIQGWKVCYSTLRWFWLGPREQGPQWKFQSQRLKTAWFSDDLSLWQWYSVVMAPPKPTSQFFRFELSLVRLRESLHVSPSFFLLVRGCSPWTVPAPPPTLSSASASKFRVRGSGSPKQIRWEQSRETGAGPHEWFPYSGMAHPIRLSQHSS